MNMRNLMKFVVPSTATLLCVMILLAVAPIASAQVTDIDKAACDQAKGVWTCGTAGVPGDGTSHVFVAATGPAGAVLGGHARAFRQGLDNQYTATCLMNPKQPPTVDNSEQRRCTAPCNDMSVEKCTPSTGSVSSVTCEYVNQKNAPNKFVEVCGCFKTEKPFNNVNEESKYKK